MRKWLFLAMLVFTSSAIAQRGPSQLWGLIYNIVTPVFSNRQTVAWQGDSSGKLHVVGLVVGPCSNSLDFSDGCNSQYLGAL